MTELALSLAYRCLSADFLFPAICQHVRLLYSGSGGWGGLTRWIHRDHRLLQLAPQGPHHGDEDPSTLRKGGGTACKLSRIPASPSAAAPHANVVRKPPSCLPSNMHTLSLMNTTVSYNRINDDRHNCTCTAYTSRDGESNRDKAHLEQQGRQRKSRSAQQTALRIGAALR